MTPKSAKAKGRRLAQLIRTKILLRFQEKLGHDDIHVTPAGVGGEDLLMSHAARECFPYSIECKNVEKLKIYESLKQAAQSNRKYPPLLIFTRNRGKVYCVLEFDELLKLMG